MTTHRSSLVDTLLNEDPARPDLLRRERDALTSAAQASVSPHMISRLGGIADSAVTALDLLTSPEIASLLHALQRASPLLVPLIDRVAEVGSEADVGGLTDRIMAAVQAGAMEVDQQPGPLRLGEVVHVLRRDPAIAAALHFSLGFAHRMRHSGPVRAASDGRKRGDHSG